MANRYDNLAGYLRRLESWRDELVTNECHMAHLAQRAIDLLEKEIDERWPGQRAKNEQPNA